MMSHNIFIYSLKFLVDIILKLITMRSDKFGSQLIEKVETGSLLSLMYMFPQKFRYFTDQNGHFSNTNIISRTVRAQKVYEKMRSFV